LILLVLTLIGISVSNSDSFTWKGYANLQGRPDLCSLPIVVSNYLWPCLSITTCLFSE